MNDTLAQAVIEDGDVMLKSIAVWKGCLIGALALSVPFFRGLSFADKLALLWYVYDMLVHVIMEGSFLYVSLTGTAETSDFPLAFLWREYGKADRRWAISDPTIVSLELLTVVLCSLLCILLAIAIVNRKPWRHFVQVFLCVMELYGGWMTFCPEWLTGNPNLDGSNPVYLWVYLWFANGIWVVIPAILLWQSFVAMNQAFSTTGGAAHVKTSKKSGAKAVDTPGKTTPKAKAKAH
jgi:hypothetical protein